MPLSHLLLALGTEESDVLRRVLSECRAVDLCRLEVASRSFTRSLLETAAADALQARFDDHSTTAGRQACASHRYRSLLSDAELDDRFKKLACSRLSAAGHAEFAALSKEDHLQFLDWLNRNADARVCGCEKVFATAHMFRRHLREGQCAAGQVGNMRD